MKRNELPAWRALEEHRSKFQGETIANLFASEKFRSTDWQVRAPFVTVDFSRQLANRQTLDLLQSLATECGVAEHRDAMFAGANVNASEGRPAWHTALRTPPSNGAVRNLVEQQREKFLSVAEELREQTRRGTLRDLIVIGIGGSDLGPRLVTAALGPSSGPRIHFVNNVDPVVLNTALAGASPETSAVVAISKSFTTLEIVENLKAAATWLGAGVDDDSPAASNLYAVTSMPDRAAAFGISAANTMTFPDWVGGRFSLWSACGLPAAVAHGRENFVRLLAGAAAMDEHFLGAAPESNAPVLLALLDIWNTSFLKIPGKAVFPYGERLRFLTPYLQQLEMESNGKRVDTEGKVVDYPTAVAVWGGAGTTAQHSVFQFLHQGTWLTSVEFVLVDAMRASADARERLLIAFAEAQADALAFGDSALSESNRLKSGHAECPGSRPSALSYLDNLEPESIGALLALYEHRTAAASWVWGINAFDQWGVEIGKKLLAIRSLPND